MILSGNRRNTTRGTNTTGIAQGVYGYSCENFIYHVAALLSIDFEHRNDNKDHHFVKREIR
jgi:hypothetical protein